MLSKHFIVLHNITSFTDSCTTKISDFSGVFFIPVMFSLFHFQNKNWMYLISLCSNKIYSNLLIESQPDKFPTMCKALYCSRFLGETDVYNIFSFIVEWRSFYTCCVWQHFTRNLRPSGHEKCCAETHNITIYLLSCQAIQCVCQHYPQWHKSKLKVKRHVIWD